MTTIVHYGAGNIRSVQRALERLGEPSVITSDPEVVRKANRLILPGVGSFDAAMQNLKSHGLVEVLRQRVLEEGVPILGICLGLQLFTQSSEEGTEPGLGWIAGATRRFEPIDATMKIPHIGWNEIAIDKTSSLFAGFPDVPSLYFVHSYYVTCEDPSVVVARTTYGQTFVSAIQTGNIHGVQFHPEKSQQIGLQLLANFLGTT